MNTSQPQSQRGVPDSAELQESATPLTILVVDDDEATLSGLSLALSTLGHKVLRARDGVEALELFDRAPLDVVLSDWRMPRMSGIELCREVRARSRVAYFILVTGLGDKAHLLEAMAAGADDFLAKPLDLDELQARLLAAKRVLGLHRALRARNRELRRDGERLFAAARVDALTNVRNRLALDEDLLAITSNARRYGERCSGALCDIDHFKRYNDAFGHLEGDRALRRVAEIMSRELRQGDELYRYGGEEFFVVLRQQSAETAKLAMERVRRALESASIAQPEGAAWPVVTLSTGIAELTINDTPETWLRRADGALYAAKSRGRNCVEIASG